MKKILIEIEFDENEVEVFIDKADGRVKAIDLASTDKFPMIILDCSVYAPTGIIPIRLKMPEKTSSSIYKPETVSNKSYESGQIEVFKDTVKMFYSLVEKAVK